MWAPRSRAGRRALTAGVGVAAVVATAAVANASVHGRMFGMSGGARMNAMASGRPAATRAAGQTMAGQGMAGQGTSGQISGQMSGPMVRDALSRSAMCLRTAPGAMSGARPGAMTARTPFGPAWWRRTRLTIKPFADRKDPAFTQLLGINDAGLVVGYFGSGADPMHPNQGIVVRPPYLPGDVLDRNVRGAVQTQEIGIDAVGAQVGFSVAKDGTTSGFVRLGNTTRAVRNPLGTARPRVDQLLGINDLGWAVGFYDDARGTSHGYLYNVCTGRFSPVQIPVAHTGLQATAVNDAGVVSGFYLTGKAAHGFVLDHGRFRGIDLGSRMMTQALGLDAAGDVVGSYEDAKGMTHGFVWSRGHLRTVDVPHAAGGTVVNGLNDRGQLVGFFTTADKRTVGFLAS